MPDPTIRPAAAETPDRAPTAAEANGVAVADVRTLRRVSRAAQERLSADADVERRARAARLALELRGQRRQAARRERDAATAGRHARAQARRTRRAAGRARWAAAAPLWADRALFVRPILFPMAVAWVGQFRFAMTVMGWPLAAAVVFAAGFELSTAYVARLDWLSRAAGDSGLLFRGATWAFAIGAATMNYWHAAGPGFAPNGEAVSYGLMSITGVVLWELLSTYRHRTALRAEGKRPAARPRFGLARWIRFRPLTGIASLLALRDGYPTIDEAWDAALRAVETYGTPNNARKAIRAGRPVPPSAPSTINETRSDRDDPIETADQRDPIHRDDVERDVPRPVAPSGTATADREWSSRDVVSSTDNDRGRLDQTHDTGKAVGGDDPAAPTPVDRTEVSRKRRVADGAVREQMEAYARASLAAGDEITGADLDRRFGTRDYGRKVLRQVLASTDHGPAARLERILAPVDPARSDAAG